MTTTIDAPVQPPAAAPTPGLSRRDQLAFVVFSTWIIGGLFLDGWSHQVRKPESFFTPWHALLYSGFGVSVAFSAWDGRRAAKAGEFRELDRLSTVGVALFALGMVSDFAWHMLLGIEVNVEGLLSPTHLTLMTGGLLLASTPARVALRVAREQGERRPLATFGVIQSIAATTAVVAFFTQFTSAFRGPSAAGNVALHGMGRVAEFRAIQGVTTILATNALLVGAVVYVVSRWRTKRGSLTLILGVVALAVSGLTGFNHAQLVLAALAGGLAGDLAVAFDRADLAPIAVPLAMWPAWTAVLALTGPFGWSPNVWGGAVFLSVLTGLGLRVLANPNGAPTASATMEA